MDGYGKRILVIADDPGDRALLDTRLEQEGYAVYTACDGIAGADELRRRHFDVVLADYHMPGINGLEFAEFIRMTWPDTPVILLTGELNDGTENPPELEAVARIRKPYEATLLLSVLRTVVQPVSAEQTVSPMV